MVKVENSNMLCDEAGHKCINTFFIRVDPILTVIIHSRGQRTGRRSYQWNIHNYKHYTREDLDIEQKTCNIERRLRIAILMTKRCSEGEKINMSGGLSIVPLKY